MRDEFNKILSNTGNLFVKCNNKSFDDCRVIQ